MSFNYNGNFFVDGYGSSIREYQPSVTVRPRAVVVGRRRASAIATSVDRHAVGEQRHRHEGRTTSSPGWQQTTVSFTARVSYTMKPTLSLQLYAEPFVSAGDYSAFKELVDGRNPVYADRYSPFAYADNPDFNYRSFRTTNVLRWEYRPGSTLFVVWQHAREGSVADGTFRFRRDFHDLFESAARTSSSSSWPTG